MEYAFYFESKFRDWDELNFLKFQVTDGTEFSMSEVWCIADQRKKRTPIQKLLFRKENNYDRKYLITVEVSSAWNYTSGKFVLSRLTKPVSTSIIILLQNYNHLQYSISSSVPKSICGLEIHEKILTETFRYKVILTRVHTPQEFGRVEKCPERDCILALSDGMHSILENGDFADVILTDGFTEIRAHKNILFARSSYYFRPMFSGNWKSEGATYVDTTRMKIMKEVLHYMYSGIVRPMEFDTMRDMVKAADFYLLEDLKKLLSIELRKRIVVPNSVDVLLLAQSHGYWELKKSSLDFIVKKFDKVKLTESWGCLDRQAIIQEVNDAVDRRNIAGVNNENEVMEH